MARPLRIQYAGAWYHVMNRGAGRRIIFPGDRFRARFLSLLSDMHERYRVEVHAWCLMGNHYHLLSRTPLPNLARAMRHLDGVYAQYHNRVRRTDGPLFRGRYTAIVVDSDAYLAQLSRYIHRNPVEAGLTARAETWRWSSYSAYIGITDPHPWLFTGDVLRLFGSPGRYRAFVDQGVDDEIRKFYEAARHSPVLGSDDFRERVGRLSDPIDMTEIPDRRRLRQRPALDCIIETTATAFDVAPADLLVCRQGHTNIPRAVAMHLCSRLGDYPLKEIAAAFRMTSYTSVPTAIKRLQSRLDDPALRRQVDRLERQLFEVD